MIRIDAIANKYISLLKKGTDKFQAMHGNVLLENKENTQDFIYKIINMCAIIFILCYLTREALGGLLCII